MRKIILFLVIINLAIISVVTYFTQNQSTEKQLAILKREFTKTHTPSVDHSKFAILKNKFSSPQEVTEACLSCHTERGKEMLKTAHFQWSRTEYMQGKGIVDAGKKNLINNFCVGIASNEQLCNKCHAGYGWSDTTFDFTSEKNIDCLACHDNSGGYSKKNNAAGYLEDTVDLNKCAQNVGLPQKNNCGACHFLGGGGNNVKHGDLETALLTADADIDVHLGYDGGKMECVACHTAENHVLKGKMYSVSSMNRNRARCSDCHGNTPHEDNIIDEHTVKVSCQTCHIPTYAKVNATKTHWDWSAAGKFKDGKPYSDEDEDGNHTYLSYKGEFIWGKNLTPDYVWFNGTASHYLLGEKIDTSKITEINTLYGEYSDLEAQIIPVKIHYATQIFDKKTNMLISPALAGEKGSGAYWSDYNWDESAKKGMAYVGLPYSGEYGFTKTKMYWPINHMVSKADKALSCTECHSNNSRLKNLTDFYMPGRDQNQLIEATGSYIILLTIFGVFGHAILRIYHYVIRNIKQNK